jgi:formate dehydrogenase major subunit
MSLNRRQWFKVTAGIGAGLALSELGVNLREMHGAVRDLKIAGATEFTTACNFCACGCGMICQVRDGKLVNLEGDPDHVINQGALCSKGAAMSAVPNSPQRLKKPMYRAPGSDKWEEISWDDALNRIAKKIKDTREKTWIATEKVGDVEVPVNRTDAIAFLGGAQNTNEECYLITKATRVLGTVNVEHQARVCHSPSVPSLTASFGRGAMTNHWLDLQNSKVFLIEGSNVAENHVMAMKWIRKAQEKGAIIIHVDPRYTRTSSTADIYACIRAGADIAFLGAVINYIIENKFYDEEYVKLHTNALMLAHEEFAFEDGLFSGYDEATHHYEMASWGYKLGADKKPAKARSLEDPHCVFAKVKQHYSRYTMQASSEISGIPVEMIKKIADTLVNNRPGTILYALGATQHTVGVQNIRCYGILQLLLGNIGKPGGGVNALRGQPNVQGGCDMAVLNNYLPGYLTYPGHNEPTLKDWTKNNGTFRAKFLVNNMKAWFGDKATVENDYGYAWLPKRSLKKDHTIYGFFESAYKGDLKFLYVIGQNPMVTNANLTMTFDGLSKLETLVVPELWDTETSSFWQRPGVDPKTIQTEVFLLPSAYFMEKEGTITGSGRLVQWRYKAVNPPGESKADLEVIDAIFRKLRGLYANSTDPKDLPIQNAVWNYPKQNMAEEILKEIAGVDLKTGQPVNGIADLQPDGTTSCGVWIYAGCFKGGKNLTKRRDSKTDPSGLGIYPGFAWTWPGNRHILYNRASCDEKGQPFDKSRAIVWWDAAQKKWAGWDTPDVPVPTDGPDTPNGQRAFRMSGEGVGRLLAASYKDPDPRNKDFPRDASYTPKDGPLPEFYEPVESPAQNALHAKVQNNPCVKYPRVKSHHPIGTRDKYPYVLMTSSLAEHWCAGSTTRNVPWLTELAPEPVVEIPEKLAKKLGIDTGDMTKVSSARGEITVKAVVTKRMQTLQINGQEVATVWMPYNWGFSGLNTGPSTNYITIDAVDPGAGTQETKACLVNVARVGRVEGGDRG